MKKRSHLNVLNVISSVLQSKAILIRLAIADIHLTEVTNENFHSMEEVDILLRLYDKHSIQVF